MFGTAEARCFRWNGCRVRPRFSLLRTAILCLCIPLVMATNSYNYALSLLAARAYTVRGMRRKLAQKGFTADESERTVERLVSSGLLDEARYAAEFARQRLVVGGVSVRRVEQQLAGRGIQRDVAKAATAKVVEDENLDTLASLEKIAGKKLATMGDLDPIVKRRRLFGFLARKGYELDEIKEVVSRALA